METPLEGEQTSACHRGEQSQSGRVSWENRGQKDKVVEECAVASARYTSHPAGPSNCLLRKVTVFKNRENEFAALLIALGGGSEMKSVGQSLGRESRPD